MASTHVPVKLAVRGAHLDGDLTLPDNPRTVVAFAHGSGSGRHSPRNGQVARALNDAGHATLLVDLLTPDEGVEDARTFRLRFDTRLLGARMTAVVDALASRIEVADLPIVLFGASTGAAAALRAAADRPGAVRAVVSRGGRPDLAGEALGRVWVPVLLIVGGADTDVLALNREAAARMPVRARLEVVPGATHLFEEPGAMDRVVDLVVAELADRFGPGRPISG